MYTASKFLGESGVISVFCILINSLRMGVVIGKIKNQGMARILGITVLFPLPMSEGVGNRD
jgi:hypothetical protein